MDHILVLKEVIFGWNVTLKRDYNESLLSPCASHDFVVTQFGRYCNQMTSIPRAHPKNLLLTLPGQEIVNLTMKLDQTLSFFILTDYLIEFQQESK